nr:hypothetical protein [Paenibacillus selenitireducens]
MIEQESVFGQLKNNRGFRRFLLRGFKKSNPRGRVAYWISPLNRDSLRPGSIVLSTYTASK